MSRLRWMFALAAAATVCLLSAVPASGSIGNWNGNRGCPVDDPVMLASPAGNYTACVDFFGGGPWKLGNLKLRGNVYGDFGVYGPTADDLSMAPGAPPQGWYAEIDGSSSLQPPTGTACYLLFPPQGGEPNDQYTLCLELAQRTNLSNLIAVHPEPAGDPSDFRLSGAAGTGPAITLPVKFRLVSPALGSNCYIGSNAKPIVLHLSSILPPAFHRTSADPNGYPVTWDDYAAGGDLQDTSFAVPAAHGCGSAAMDTVLSRLFGLPSRRGKNSFSISRDLSTQSTTAGGSVLSAAYHAALGP